MRLSDEDFAFHVAAHAGGVDLHELHQLSELALAAIAGYLSPGGRELIASELPEALGAAVEHSTTTTALPVEAHLVGAGLSAGRARELLASICRVLAEELSTEALDHVRRAVPPEVADLIATSSSLPRMPAGAQSHLADGRPGSAHPISEARPTRAQADSVAASDPHGDTKLSSTTGTTQERRHETLAQGHPATRPLSNSRG